MRLLFFILLFPASVFGAILASDGSDTDVQAKHDGATDGDTITLPSGTFGWSTGVILTKRVYLQGLGTVTLDSSNIAFTCGTKITDNISGGASIIKSTVPSYSGLAFSVYGIQFQSGTRTYDGTDDGAGIEILSRYDSRRIRVSYCVFTNLAGYAISPQTVYGVIDHNRIRGNHQVPVAYVKGQLAAADGSNTWGDEPWGDNDNYGTDKFLYFEDNNMGTDLPGFHLTGIDGSYGGRVTVRLNILNKISMENHGVEAERDRSLRLGECYTNWFVGDDSGNIVGFHRGGSWLYHGNKISGYLGSAASIGLLNDRSREPLAYPFGGSDGHNPWDLNSNAAFDTGTVTTDTSTHIATSQKKFVASGESYTLNQYRGFTVTATSGKTVSSITRVGSTVTVSCTAHGFTHGVATIYAINSGGSGYTVNDVLTISGGTGTAGTLTVNTVSGGVITAASVTTAGAYSVVPVTEFTGNASVTGGTGTGATFKLTYTHPPVSIWGADQQGYNFRFQVSISDANTFVFSTSYLVPTPATGTIKCRLGANFAEIISNSTDTVYYNDSGYYAVSPFNFHMDLKVGDTYEINKVTNSFGMIGRGKDSTALSGDYPSVPGSFSQAVTPCYECNNTREGGANVDFSNDSAAGPFWVLVNGRDFTNDTCLVHTDYQYPHELVGGLIPTGTSGTRNPTKIRGIRVTK